MLNVKVLGIAQDGGVPHLFCSCSNCRKFHHNVASLLVETSTSKILIDATPNITEQLGNTKIDAVIITHLHIGHYIGLLYFGKEVANTKKIPLFSSASNLEFLQSHEPFATLIRNKNLIPYAIYPDQEFTIKELTIMPFEVPHRNEFGNTLGIEIIGRKRLVYIPDMDYLSQKTIDIIQNSDISLIDGTFFSNHEIPRQENVPHPPILQSIKKLNPELSQIIFTHLNHTNPALNIQSNEYSQIKEMGFDVADEGRSFNI